MKKTHLIAIPFILFACACNDNDLIKTSDISGEDYTSIRVPDEAIDGELLIKFSLEVSQLLDDALTTRTATDGVFTRSGIPTTDEILDILGTYRIERVFPVDRNAEERTREEGLHLWYIVYFDQNNDLKEAIKQLNKLGEITKVQCNQPIKRLYDTKQKPLVVSEAGVQRLMRSSTSTLSSDEFSFSDPLLPLQWGYINRGDYEFVGGEYNPYAKVIAGSDVGCEAAWELCTGDPSIIVAILDEGVMYDHPDLAANMWINEGEEFNAGQDTDGNGYKDDKYGYNFVRDRGAISYSDVSDTGHATHIAGTIAAVNNNGIGVCGIAGGDGSTNSGVKIMSCQLFDGEYVATVAGEAKAMKYAADNGAVIIQCSWGYYSALANGALYIPGPGTEKEWEELYPLEKEALDYFVQNAGSPNGVIDGGLAVFASGNEFAAKSSFPAAYSRCISVSAVAADFTPASYTNYGDEVAFCAPGGDGEYYCIPGIARDEYDTTIAQGLILSTLPGENGEGATYGYYEGTSMACPHVSGVAALGLSYAYQQRRHFTVQEFIDLMSATATDVDSYYNSENEKVYYYNFSTIGNTPTRMELSQYKGKMGRLVNAGALLNAISTAGSEMKVPNVYVAPGKEVTMDVARYFLGGEKLTYQCSTVDSSVAVVTVNGTQLVVKGIATGSTTATLTIGNEKTQTFVITVRPAANGNGWM